VVIDAIRHSSGELVGFAKITRDMTDLRASHEALRESEERFRMLVHGVTDYAIYMISPTGQVTNWNAGAERIKGYSRDEIVGSDFSVFYTEEDRAKGLPAHTLETAATEGRFEEENWRRRKDGTVFWAHVVVDAIRDEAGELVGFAKITRDITERKHAAEALERANAAVFQSKKMEAITQLTGEMARDFNELLVLMSRDVDALSERLMRHADLELLTALHLAVERGTLLTQQLLSFARRQSLKPENYSLKALINDLEPILRCTSTAAIKMEIRQDAQPITVLVDASRLEAALLELVVNARDAMPEGGELVVAVDNVTLRPGGVGSLAAGPYARIFVGDTGSGMPQSVLTRAFEPFFTTKEPGKGAGLGLSQVYGFITQSGGDVEIQSEEGKGTTVIMYFPVAERPLGNSTAPNAEMETILIVDDEENVLDATAELLSGIGYGVVTATDGIDALEILRRRTDIDILITDVVMPKGMSGVELARIAVELNPALQVVVTSGYPLPDLEIQCGHFDEFAFIQKPFRLPELARALQASR
jgi:PAS domain S-box-containing protein